MAKTLGVAEFHKIYKPQSLDKGVPVGFVGQEVARVDLGELVELSSTSLGKEGPVDSTERRRGGNNHFDLEQIHKIYLGQLVNLSRNKKRFWSGSKDVPCEQ